MSLAPQSQTCAIPGSVVPALPTTGDRQFAYQPLAGPTSIRLLQVEPPLPTRDKRHIRIKLHEEPWSSCRAYRCLSYTWGDQSQTFPILVNGYTMRVGRSLYEFLQFAAAHFCEERFWVDAISINQSDDAEKSVQVQRMGTLFSSASETWVWMGKDKSIERLFKWADQSPNALDVVKRYLPTNPTPHRLQNGLKRLEQHPYWYRAWVTQEMLLATKLKFVCGPTAINVDALSRCARRRWSFRGSTIELSKRDLNLGVHLSNHLEFLSMSTTRTYDFWTILAHRYNSKCMYPRDRLYSLLAFVSAANMTFKVDYSEEIMDVFWKFTNYIGAWNNPTRIGLLCDTLGLTVSEIERWEPPHKGHMEIPLRPCELHSGSKKRSSGSLTPGKAAFCDYSVERRSSFCIDAYRTGDLLFCSGTDINRHDADHQSLHVLLRRSTPEPGSLLAPFVCVGSAVNQLPDHSKLRFRDNSGREKTEEVALLMMSLRQDKFENRDSETRYAGFRLSLKLTSGYLLQCFTRRMTETRPA